MRFAIFTHVEHKYEEQKYYAYAPYVREMNIWLKHVDEVEIVAPVDPHKEFMTDLHYAHNDLHFSPIPAINFLSTKKSLESLFKIPVILGRIFRAMRSADHLHIRCPGNIGLLACIVQVFFPSKKKTVKYAGNWDPQARQPWSYKLQKWILSNTFLTRNMQVLVYGEWAGQTKNVVPFFTASFSEKEKVAVRQKNFSGPFTFLFVGNLVEGKRPLEAIKLVEEINRRERTGTDSETCANFKIYGDGPERGTLKTYCSENGLEEQVTFKGNRSLEELKEAYQKGHFVILPSKSEGWPKAVAEAMFFGCIPIATPVSCLPWMLGFGSRGVLLDELKNQEPGAKKLDMKKEGSVVSGHWAEDVEKISELMKNAGEMQRMSAASKQWSQQYTLEKFEKEIVQLL